MSTRSTDRAAIDRAVNDEVAVLTEMILRERPDVRPLDRSYESLDGVEDFYRGRLEATEGTRDDALAARMAAYVGATLIERTGSRWEPPRTPADMGRSSVTGLPHLARARFYPMDVVRTFRRTRASGYIRDATEKYDIPHRRTVLAQLVANTESIVAQLASDLKQLIGDPGITLDGSPNSVGLVEEGFKRVMSGNPTREILRRMDNGALLYLGRIVQRAVGGEWTLTEDPKDADFAEAAINGWAPIAMIRKIRPDREPGILQNALEIVINARKQR